MHVLVLPSWYPTTEAPLHGIYFAEQAQCLSRHGMQVGVVYPEQQSLRRLSWTALSHKHFQTEWTRDHGLPTLRRYGWNVWWRFPPGIRLRVRSAVRLAHRYVDRHGAPDLIHAQSGRWAGAAAARIARSLSIPYVLTEHFSGFQRGSLFPWRRPLMEEGYRYADGIAAVSTTLRDALTESGLAPSSNIEVHPNLVSPRFFPPPSGRPPPPPFHVVTVTRLTDEKNVDGLIEAFSRLADESPHASLSIVGGGPREPELKDKAHDTGIDDRINFLGRLDRESVRAALWDAHAFVLPSHHETFGVVLLEALATGLPVVATRCGGPEDIVTDDVGHLVPRDDPSALAEALSAIQNSWAAYDADAIRRYAVERYGPDPFVQRTRTFYAQALHSGPTSS